MQDFEDEPFLRTHSLGPKENAVNARFAGLCRRRPLDLLEAELEIAPAHQEDGRRQRKIYLTAYRDKSNFFQSNVAFALKFITDQAGGLGQHGDRVSLALRRGTTNTW